MTIQDNDFENSAYAGGVAIYSCPKLRAVETNKDIIYSGKLLIEGNRFTQAEKRILQVSHAADVVVRNNTFKKDAAMPSHWQVNESGISYEHCGKVDIEELKEV